MIDQIISLIELSYKSCQYNNINNLIKDKFKKKKKKKFENEITKKIIKNK